MTPHRPPRHPTHGEAHRTGLDTEALPRPVASASAPGAGVGVLQTRAISVTLGGRRVLHALDLDIARGWTAVVGPNGAGKSTLLRTLAGLCPPREGRVLLDGRPLDGPTGLPARERARRLAWLAQSGETTGDLTLRETVALGRLPHTGLWGRPGADDDAAIDAALTATDCAALQHRPLLSLSGGERQRALLARALASGADVLLLDEPTSHLDPPHQAALARIARQLAADRTVVTVVHDLNLALAADRVLLLDRGQLRAFAPAGHPELHAALEDAFGGTIRIRRDGDRAWVMPAW